MANNNSIRLNHNALAAILKTDVVDALEAAAERAVAATGRPAGDYEIETWVGRNRARVSVKPATFPARARENRDHLLVRGLAAIQAQSGD